ncbi:MAG: 50S ribosomal protein L32 [Parcubacteria group bacterium]
MGLPAKRRTNQSKRERASHFALKPLALASCPKCKKHIRPHHVCPYCGYYRGHDVLKLDIKAERKRAKKKKREDRAKNQ